MLFLVKTVGSVIIRTRLLYSLSFAMVLVLLPISARAQCSNWDVGGYMKIYQRGSSPVNRLTLVQKGKVITGTASFVETEDNDVVEGTVDGTINGDSFSIQIFWSNRQIGVYNGKVLPSGRLDGEAYEKSSPQSRTIWHSEGVLKCAPPPPTVPKPIKSSGKRPPTPPSTPAPTPPFIIAGQPIIPPYMAYGTVYLGWEGGPDHPNVEVFLSIDNGAEIPAFSMEHAPQSPVWKQPKMVSIPLKLQRYHHYKFVLKAAGKTLSTAAFVVP